MWRAFVLCVVSVAVIQLLLCNRILPNWLTSNNQGVWFLRCLGFVGLSWESLCATCGHSLSCIEFGSWVAWPGAKKTNTAFLKCLDTWHSFMRPFNVADVASSQYHGFRQVTLLCGNICFLLEQKKDNWS